MGHVKDKYELWAMELLQQIIDCSNRDRDALPGSMVKKVKEARNILRKRQEYKGGGRK